MGSAIAVFVLVAAFALAVLAIINDVRRSEAKLSQAAKVDKPSAHESLSAAEIPASLPPHENYVFLQSVRERSCYRMLRDVHGIVTCAAIFVIAIAWVVLLNISGGPVHGIYATLVCGLVIVAAVIEYGFFRMVVDAVDVLIDTSRRNGGSKGSE